MLQQLEQEMRSKYSPHKSSTHTQQEDEALKYLDPYLLTTEILHTLFLICQESQRKRYTDTTYTQQYRVDTRTVYAQHNSDTTTPTMTYDFENMCIPCFRKVSL